MTGRLRVLLWVFLILAAARVLGAPWLIWVDTQAQQLSRSQFQLNQVTSLLQNPAVDDSALVMEARQRVGLAVPQLSIDAAQRGWHQRIVLAFEQQGLQVDSLNWRSVLPGDGGFWDVARATVHLQGDMRQVALAMRTLQSQNPAISLSGANLFLQSAHVSGHVVLDIPFEPPQEGADADG